MKKYALRRIITSLFTLLVILGVLFLLMQLMPGSPFNDEKLNDDQRMALYAKYGLDQPLFTQFFRYVKNMLQGDFGVSYNISKNTPISQLIQTRLPISIRIGGCAVLIGAGTDLRRNCSNQTRYGLGFPGDSNFRYRRFGSFLCICPGIKLYPGL